jgi:hypothetical protein
MVQYYSTSHRRTIGVSTVLTHSTQYYCIYTQKRSLLSHDETAEHAVEDATDTTHGSSHYTVMFCPYYDFCYLLYFTISNIVKVDDILISLKSLSIQT